MAITQINDKFRREVILRKRLSDPSAIPVIGACIHSSELMVIERTNGGNTNQRRGT